MRNLIFIFLSISILYSCAGEQLNGDQLKGTSDYDLALRSSGLEDLYLSLDTLWTLGYSDFSRETFCACDTSSIIAMVDVVNNNQHLLPLEVQGLQFSSDYNLIYNNFRLDCVAQNDADYSDRIKNIIETANLSEEEKNLFIELFDYASDGEFTEEEYQQIFNELIDPNEITILLLENAFSIKKYIYDNPELFDEGDGVQAFI